MEPLKPAQKSSIPERIRRLHVLMNSASSSENEEVATEHEAGQEQENVVPIRESAWDNFGNYVLQTD